MDTAGTQEWPDERLKVLVPVWTLTLISTAFLVWRVVYGLRSRKFIICDYLLIIATVSLGVLQPYNLADGTGHGADMVISGSQHRSDVAQSSSREQWSWTPYHGPYGLPESQNLQLLSMDHTDR
jgi:hypothetical protein